MTTAYKPAQIPTVADLRERHGGMPEDDRLELIRIIEKMQEAL
jgi:hypothetical protein